MQFWVRSYEKNTIIQQVLRYLIRVWTKNNPPRRVADDADEGLSTAGRFLRSLLGDGTVV